MNTTETTTVKRIMTPIQFTVARALASAYGHLWSGVPDGTYDLYTIEEWSKEHENTLPGIRYPSHKVEDEDGTVTIYHATGTGRLAWEIEPFGSVDLKIFRPKGGVDDEGMKVAHVTLVRDYDEDNPDNAGWKLFKLLYLTSDESEKKKNNNAVYDEAIRDDILFQRHVHALVRPIVSLLLLSEPSCESQDAIPEEVWDTMTEEEKNQYWDKNHEMYQDWRVRVLEPAIAKAKEVLAPLFAKALPEEASPAPEPDSVRDYTYPQTYWMREDQYDPSKPFATIHHHGDSFPVESEKTAVHAVLLLLQPSILKLSLLDAIKIAIASKSYRLEENEALHKRYEELSTKTFRGGSQSDEAERDFLYSLLWPQYATQEKKDAYPLMSEEAKTHYKRI